MMTITPDWAHILVLIVLFALVMVWAGKRAHARESSGKSLGWGKLLLMVLVLLVAGSMWSRHVRRNELQQQEALRQAEQANLQADQARHDAEEAVRGAAEQAGSSIQQMWEQLNKPRINLKADGQTATIEATDGTQTVVMTAGPEPATNAAKPAAPEPPGPPALVVKQGAATESVAKAVEVEIEEAQAEAKAEVKAAAVEIAAGAEAFAENLEDRGRGRPGSQGPPVKVEVARIEEPSVASPRPAWVDDPPKRVGEVWREVVVAGDYETTDECYQAADDLLCVAVWDHVQRLTGHEQTMAEAARKDGDPAAKLVRAPFARMALGRMGVGIDTIRRDMVPEDREWLETVERSFGPMKKIYTQLEFSPSVDRELKERWKSYEREERLMAVGGIGGLMVGGVGLAYGLLKVDTWTKGYYTKRLFLGVPAAIIGAIAAAAAIVGP